MGMGLLDIYLFIIGPTIVFFLCDSFSCSPVNIFCLYCLQFYSCATVIGPSDSSGVLWFVNGAILLFLDVYY